MTGMFVAIVALLLGATGPRFRWRGAALLLGVMVGTGIVATMAAAAAARADELLFVVTPGSVVAALAGQALFAFGFYGLGALLRRIVDAVAARRVRLF